MPRNENAILIVDDDPDICKALVHWLTQDGYTCEIALTGQAAYDKLAEKNFALVILDFILPDISGISVLDHTIHNHKNVAVIMATGVDDHEIAQRSIELGAYGYIIKPFERNELLVNVSNGLRRRDLEIENQVHRDTLQQLVLERTKELKSANSKLRQEVKERKQSERSLSVSLKESAQLASDLKKAYEELKSSQKQILQQEKMACIGQLSAGIAHEINNPTGYIKSNLNSMAKYIEKLIEFSKAQAGLIESSLSVKEKKEALKKLRKELKIDFVLEDIPGLLIESLDGTDRIIKIVQGLKGFSRKDQDVCVAANVNDCLDNTLNIIWNELKYKAQVHKEYGELPVTKCHPQQLSQVFMNLLINAAHAIKDRGDISIKTWAEKDKIFTRISDTGCGIAKKNIKKIFEPFFTTKEEGLGTGLGLSIISDIIKAHDGEISVESEIGKGTVFTLQFPVLN